MTTPPVSPGNLCTSPRTTASLDKPGDGSTPPQIVLASQGSFEKFSLTSRRRKVLLFADPFLQRGVRHHLEKPIVFDLVEVPGNID